MKLISTKSYVIVRAFVLFVRLGNAHAQGPDIDPTALRTDALKLLAPLPDKMPRAENDSAPLIALGRELYFEKRLSQNGSQSCATCHPLNGGRAGVDNQPTSAGALGKRGERNSPTTLNAGFHFVQFWDGRAKTVEEQAKGPLLNPVEMAMPDATAVVSRLESDTNYSREFVGAFPGQGKPLTFDNILSAIGAFERTLVTHDRFDDFLKGQDNALTPVEQKGLAAFLTTGCTTCHNGPLLGGNSFKKLGIFKPYANKSDLGRGAIVKSDDDIDETFQFKVASLRNIAATGPYFHDGGVATLPEAVRDMARMQLAVDLTAEQEQELVAFLRCLTGKGIIVDTPVKEQSSTSAKELLGGAQ